MVGTLYEKIVIRNKTGRLELDRSYSNLYIYNPYQVSGEIVLNDDYSINPQDIDLIEKIPGGVKSIKWNFQDLPGTIILYLSDAYLKPHELVFKVEEALPVDVQNATLDVNITNSNLGVNIVNSVLYVDQALGSVWDINVTNSVIGVNVTNSVITVDQALNSVWDINVTNSVLAVDVQNSVLNVNVNNSVITVNQATGSVWDINITNSVLAVDVQNSVLDVNISGTTSVSIDSATITVDTAISDIKVRYPAPQIDYNYSIIIPSTYSRNLDLPFVIAIYNEGSFEILNIPPEESIPLTGSTRYTAVQFSKPLYRPSYDPLYSISLNEEADTFVNSYTFTNADLPYEVVPQVWDFGQVINASNVYIIGHILKAEFSATTDSDTTIFYADMYIEVSTDGVNWTPIVDGSASTVGVSSTKKTLIGDLYIYGEDFLLTGPISFRYIRFRAKFYQSGNLSTTYNVDFYYGIKKLLIWI